MRTDVRTNWAEGTACSKSCKWLTENNRKRMTDPVCEHTPLGISNTERGSGQLVE